MADAMGLKSPKVIGNILYRENSVRVNSFVKVLNLMGYEVVVREAGIGEKEEWKVEQRWLNIFPLVYRARIKT